jgi:hypothetical protein
MHKIPVFEVIADFTQPTSRSRMASLRLTLCAIVPAAAILCLLAWCYVSCRWNFSWDDAEPEILNLAWRVASGQDVYRGIESPPYAFAVYPPLYYAVVALPMRWTGLGFLPAKLVSLLSSLAIAWALVLLARRWKLGAGEGCWAACLLFLIPAFLYNAVRCHPQTMAVALSLWSLVFFLRNRWLDTVVISPILSVLAIYTKQTQLALPVALLLYLALRNRRWLWPFLATTLIAGMLPLLWLQKATAGFFLYDIIGLSRLSYMAWQIPGIFIHHAGPIFLFIGLALTTSWRRFRERRWEVVDLYLATVVLTTIVSLGRIGAHTQYVVELLVAVLLFLLRTTGLYSMRGRDALLAFQVLFLVIYAPLYVFLEEGLEGMAKNRVAGEVYKLVQNGTGPILSQQASFSLFGRGEVYLELMHFTTMSRIGLWDQQLLLREMEKHTFSWIITEFSAERGRLSADDQERFTVESVSALRRNYQLCKIIHPYYIYGPRSPDSQPMAYGSGVPRTHFGIPR